MASAAKKLGCALAAALGVATACLHPLPTAAADLTRVNVRAEARLLSDINADRLAAGVGPLAHDTRLDTIARYRARFLVEHAAFTHCANLAASCPPSQYHFALLLRRAGVPYAYAGENLAEDTTSGGQLADQLNDDWMRSPGHYDQIVNPAFNATGFGVVCCTVLRDDQGVPAGNASVAVEIFAQEPPLTFGVLHRR